MSRAEAARPEGGVLVFDVSPGQLGAGRTHFWQWGWPVTAVFSRTGPGDAGALKTPGSVASAIWPSDAGRLCGVGKVLKNRGAAVMLADPALRRNGVGDAVRSARAAPQGPFLFACRFNA